MNLQTRHLDEIVADFTGRSIRCFDIAKRYTDSPIEALMFWAIWYACEKNGEALGIMAGNEIPDPAQCPGPSIYIVLQARIGRYKADFALVSSRGGRIVIECDGHEFHEKTKQQAQHDKSRDRFIQDKGWKVFRFTGSEIYRSPLTCAESALLSLTRANLERSEIGNE